MRGTLEQARDKLAGALAKKGPRLVTAQDLDELLTEAHERFGVAKSVGVRRLLAFLIERCGLREVRLESENYAAKTRHVYGDLSPYVIALSLHKGGYLSHGSAVYAHGLTDQIPKTIYVNREQRPQPKPKAKPSQERIDRAFSNRQRLSKLAYAFDSYRVVLLAGKNSNALGVVPIEVEPAVSAPVTGIERTLVDITVRPAYAGGLVQVLEAFRRADGRISVPKLVSILGELDYSYPYHQAIGFLMERAGYSSRSLEPLAGMEREFNFYLGYGLREPDYDAKWRIYYPKGL